MLSEKSWKILYFLISNTWTYVVKGQPATFIGKTPQQPYHHANNHVTKDFFQCDVGIKPQCDDFGAIWKTYCHGRQSIFINDQWFWLSCVFTHPNQISQISNADSRVPVILSFHLVYFDLCFTKNSWRNLHYLSVMWI